MKRLSVIIVTYNSEHDIYDCLASIRKHQDLQPEELEIIIVDNNSRDTDGMFAKLRELYGNDIVLVKNTNNGGYGQGNNVGIRMATAPVILIMNPDVRLLMPIFKTATDAFEQYAELSMYGMKQLLGNLQDSRNSFCCEYAMNGYVYTIMTSLCNHFDIFFQKYMYFSGSCFFIRRSMFTEAGLFDENIFMYGEEEDIHFRMRMKGYKRMVYNPNLNYVHMVENRLPDLRYEVKLLEAAIYQGNKRGLTALHTIKNRLRHNNVMLLREFILIFMGKKDKSLYNMLLEFRQELKERLRKEKQR